MERCSLVDISVMLLFVYLYLDGLLTSLIAYWIVRLCGQRETASLHVLSLTEHLIGALVRVSVIVPLGFPPVG